MKNKATHYGTCQACKSLQKLPGGVLSLHGYTTRYGFFEGTCFGSGHHPLETHCDLIEESVKQAERSIATLEKKIETVQNGDTMWLSHMTKYGRTFYEAKDVTLRDNMLRYTAKDAYGNPWKRSSFVANGIDLKSVVQEHNRQYVTWLQQQIQDARKYILDQRKELANWAPKPLKPVK